MTAQAIAGACSEAAPAPSSQSAPRVLLVDDDILVRQQLQAELEALGYVVLAASSGEQAVLIYSDERPSLVIMDIMLPGMSGGDAATRIREIAGDAFVAVMYLTALSDVEELNHCLAAGGDDFMNKPYNPVVLQIKLRSLDRLRASYEAASKQREELYRLQEYMRNEQEVARRIISQVQAQGEAGLSGMRHLVRSADILCGDVLLASRRPSGGLNVLIGDLTGHGLAAAVGALPVAQIFNAMTAKGFSAERVVREINSKLVDVLATGMYCAATLICFSNDGTYAHVWNGGMPDLLVSDGNGGKRVSSRHVPLGIFEDDEFDDKMDLLHLDPADRIYIYSDGLTEAVGRDGSFFGEEALAELLESGDAALAFDRVVAALDAFCDDSPIHDDISFLEVLCNKETLVPQIVAQPMSVSRKATRWSWDLEMADDTLGSVDPVQIVLQDLVSIQGLDPYKDILFTIVSELYNNALDHGVLGLESALKSDPEGFEAYYTEREKRLAELQDGFIKIHISSAPSPAGGQLTFRFQDSGSGFDYSSLISRLHDANHGLSGRGLPLLNEICERIEYQGNGNIVEATFVWQTNSQALS